MREFTKADALELIEEMEGLYGLKYEQQWKNVAPLKRAEMMVKAYKGLSPMQIEHGKNRMLTEPWPPTIPEFRSWCEVGGAWYTVDEAWVISLRHESDPSMYTTTQAKRAFDAVKQILQNEGQKAAGRAFRDVYSRIVTNAKNIGEPQGDYKPKLLEAPQQTIKAVPCPDHILAQLKSGFKAVMS